MKKYKYIGSESDARDYTGERPIVGKVYNEDAIIGTNTSVLEWAETLGAKEEWEEVFGEEEIPLPPIEDVDRYMSCSISYVKGNERVGLNFGSDDLETFKKLFNSII